MDPKLRAALEKEQHVKIPFVAEATGTAPGTIYRAIARGEIPAVRIGKSLRIPSHVARRLLGLDAA